VYVCVCVFYGVLVDQLYTHNYTYQLYTCLCVDELIVLVKWRIAIKAEAEVEVEVEVSV